MQLLTAGKRDVTTLAFAPTGAGLVAVSTNHAPRWWDLPATGTPVPLTDKAPRFCSSFTFSPDASVVGWVTESARVEHDRRTGTARIVALVPENEQVTAQSVCGPSARLVVQTVEPGARFRTRAFRADARGEWAEMWCIGPTGTSSWGLAGSLHCEQFFVLEAAPLNGGAPPRLVVRSALTGEALADAPAPTGEVDGLHAKLDGSALVVFGGSSLHYWQPGEKVEKIRTGTLTHYRSIAFHPDGRYLLAGNNDTTARLIDTRTWQVVRQYTWAIGRLTTVAISPDGQLVAAGGAKGQVVVWDLDI